MPLDYSHKSKKLTVLAINYADFVMTRHDQARAKHGGVRGTDGAMLTLPMLNLIGTKLSVSKDMMRIMKNLLLLSAALVSSGLCLAQDMGRVVSTTPVIQQVGVPRKVCSNEQVAVPQQKSGAGALMGAIAGGAMGNAVGGGGGKAAATMIGIFGGAVVGDRIEGAPETQVQNVQHCGMQTFYESRTVAYNVAYEYAGKHYSVQMPYDPGPSIALQITPIVSGARTAAPAVQEIGPEPVYVQPPVVEYRHGYRRY